MCWWLMMFLCVSNCEPAGLILNSGHAIWTECGWKRADHKVILKFRHHEYVLDSQLVDWSQTQRVLPIPPPKASVLSDREGDDWQRFISHSRPTTPEQPLVLTNKILKEHAATVRRVTPKKPKQAKPKPVRIRELERSIKYLRKMRHDLNQQLREEVTWRQAQHLIEQIDHLNKRIQEKQYWLARIRLPLVKPLASDHQERSDEAPNKSNPPVADETRQEISLNGSSTIESFLLCATLISCYTHFPQGDQHGQPHYFNRGSRA